MTVHYTDGPAPEIHRIIIEMGSAIDFGGKSQFNGLGQLTLTRDSANKVLEKIEPRIDGATKAITVAPENPDLNFRTEHNRRGEITNENRTYTWSVIPYADGSTKDTVYPSHAVLHDERDAFGQIKSESIDGRPIITSVSSYAMARVTGDYAGLLLLEVRELGQTPELRTRYYYAEGTGRRRNWGPITRAKRKRLATRSYHDANPASWRERHGPPLVHLVVALVRPSRVSSSVLPLATILQHFELAQVVRAPPRCPRVDQRAKSDRLFNLQAFIFGANLTMPSGRHVPHRRSGPRRRQGRRLLRHERPPPDARTPLARAHGQPSRAL